MHKFVEDMLERAKNNEKEPKVVLLRDVDMAEVEQLTKELQEKLRKK